MADDPINIQVSDNVDPNIEKKLNAIADSASKGATNLDQLKAALASIRGDNLNTLREQAKTTTDEIKKELDATKSLSDTDKTATSSVDALTAANKRLTASAKEATQYLTAQAAAAKAAAEGTSLAGVKYSNDGGKTVKEFSGHSVDIGTGAVKAADGIGGAAGEAAAATVAMEGLSTATKDAKAGVAGVEAAAASLGSKGPGFFGKVKTSAAGLFDTVRDFIAGNKQSSWFGNVVKDGAEAGEALEKVKGHARGSSTAIRELLVLAREGGRGDFTRMAGSASILATALGLLPIALAAAAVGFIGLYSAQKAWNTPEEQKHLKDYAESLGLTEKEMRKLTNTTVDANGKMHEHNELMVTYGDILGGVWDTAKQYGEQILKNMGASKKGIQDMSENFLTYVKGTFAVFYGYVLTLVDGIIGAAKIFYNAFYNMGVVTANALVDIWNGAINGVKKLANAAIGAYNAVATRLGGTAVELYDTSNAGIIKLTAGTRELGFSFDVAGNVAKRAGQAMVTMDEIGDRIHKNTLKRTDERIKAEAEAIKANRNAHKPKKTADPKTQEDYLADENLKLDNQIKLFGMLKDAREIQQQLDQIQEAFAKRRMPLDAQQLESFRAKLVLIQQNNKVQAEMDKIYQDINGPQQAFNIGTMALNEMMKRGYITLVQYNQQMDKLTRTLGEATDPLFKFNEDLKIQGDQIGLTADELDHYNNVEKVRQLFLAKSIDLTKNATQADKDRAKAAVDALDSQSAKKYVAQTVSSIVDPGIADRKFLASKKLFYAEIDELRQRDVLNEKQAAQAKAAVDAKYNSIKLQGAEMFFNALSGLSQSKNAELMAIGKAAAVIDATIKGYQAVQNALAEVPYPFNFAAAAAVAVTTGVQVANIISTPTNVGSYWDGGDFIVRGKTGVDANRISMAVSDGERVTVQTKAQQLAAQRGQNDNTPQGPTHVNNFFDEKSFIAAMDTQHGERVVMNIISRRKKEVKGMVGGGGKK